MVASTNSGPSASALIVDLGTVRAHQAAGELIAAAIDAATEAPPAADAPASEQLRASELRVGDRILDHARREVGTVINIQPGPNGRVLVQFKARRRSYFRTEIEPWSEAEGAREPGTVALAHGGDDCERPLLTRAELPSDCEANP
ncbi:MAG: hypothetical protein ACREDU_12965 [Methylocella sp.]